MSQGRVWDAIAMNIFEEKINLMEMPRDQCGTDSVLLNSFIAVPGSLLIKHFNNRSVHRNIELLLHPLQEMKSIQFSRHNPERLT